ncbi:MAG: hypothetical protein MRY83_06415, partial [Flavobacteriales bacterium]|nr:hypothetical protein [Flavobacteriales bacterium]
DDHGQIEKALGKTTGSIYLHYFDIEKTTSSDWNDGLYPTFALRKIDPEFKSADIIPTIFIKNDIFYEDLNIETLADNIRDLINQISEHHFQRKIQHIQVDCDWTKSTKDRYFELLSSLMRDWKVEATLRLHQIKYQEETGVPPVEKCALMLYNVGELEKLNQNSILQTQIVKDYISQSTSYPLTLSLALPIFNQTVIKSTVGRIKLLNHVDLNSLKESKKHFEAEGSNFKVTKDTLYKGFYLKPGDKLKPEIVDTKTLMESLDIVKQSQLKIQEFIFYHLDQDNLQNHELDQLISIL